MIRSFLSFLFTKLHQTVSLCGRTASQEPEREETILSVPSYLSLNWSSWQVGRSTAAPYTVWHEFSDERRALVQVAQKRGVFGHRRRGVFGTGVGTEYDVGTVRSPPGPRREFGRLGFGRRDHHPAKSGPKLAERRRNAMG